MLTSVVAYRSPTDFLDLPMAPGGDIFLRKIDGLGVKNIIAMSDAPGIPGSVFRGVLGDFRAIEIEIGYSPSITAIQDRRNDVLRFIRPDATVKLRLGSDNMETVEIVGVVETFENEPFSQDPFVKATIICSDPYFASIADVVSPLTITAAGTYTFTNEGTIPVGFKAFADDTTSFRMTRQDDSASYFEVTGAGGADHKWSTVPGDRYFSYKNGVDPFGEFNTRLQLVNRLSSWPILKPGANAFVVSNFGAGTILSAFTWRNRYGGV